MIVTFYSYRGGVGRTLALANVACLLAEDEQHPERVLIWDLDLEAPDVGSLFRPTAGKPPSRGFVDLAREFAESGRVQPLDEYIYHSEVRGVDVLPAGRVDRSYCDKLRQLDWLRFFAPDPRDPGPLFGEVLRDLRDRETLYDYVLIDSRAGLNDQAAISTQVLPDLLVVLFRLTEQDLEGLRHVVPAIRAQLRARGKQGVGLLPVASPVGGTVAREALEARDQAQALFGSPVGHIRFEEGLVSKAELLCLRRRLAETWPRPPIVGDYERLCRMIRDRNEVSAATGPGGRQPARPTAGSE